MIILDPLAISLGLLGSHDHLCNSHLEFALLCIISRDFSSLENLCNCLCDLRSILADIFLDGGFNLIDDRLSFFAFFILSCLLLALLLIVALLLLIVTLLLLICLLIFGLLLLSIFGLGLELSNQGVSLLLLRFELSIIRLSLGSALRSGSWSSRGSWCGWGRFGAVATALISATLLKLLDVSLGLIEGLLSLLVATLAILLAALALELAGSALLFFSTFPVLFLEVTAHLLHLALSAILLALHLGLEAHALNLLDLAHANLKGVVQVMLFLFFALLFKLLGARKGLLLLLQEALELALGLARGLHVLFLEDGALPHLVGELLDRIMLSLELVVRVRVLELR